VKIFEYLGPSTTTRAVAEPRGGSTLGFEHNDGSGHMEVEALVENRRESARSSRHAHLSRTKVNGDERQHRFKASLTTKTT
jgi:hypothetical protein